MAANQVQQVQTTVFKYDGTTNFTVWKRLMEMYLTTSGYGEIMKKGFAEPTEENNGKGNTHEVEKDRLLK